MTELIIPTVFYHIISLGYLRIRMKYTGKEKNWFFFSVVFLNVILVLDITRQVWNTLSV